MIPIYEDNHLLVLNKPAGLLTQPSGTDQDNLEQQAKEWIKKKCQKPGNVFLEAIHRLDKSVSGLVLFGKTSKAVSRLNQSMRDKQTKKVYWAWVEGDVGQDGILEDLVIHDDYQAKIVPESHPQAKLARLHYHILEKKLDRTLVEIDLETGRYHQIRVQFASRGHPIRGDRKYGSVQSFAPHQIALHHKRLEIPHPITKEWLIFEAPVPNLEIWCM